MTARRRASVRNSPDRTRPTAAQAYGEMVWHVVDQAGEAGALRDHILMETGATPSQFEGAKGFIRDFKCTAEGKAFLAYRGTYITTTDPNRCAEYVGWRLRGIDKELRRMLTGATDPLGSRVQEHAVLNFYANHIHRMLETADDIRKLGFPIGGPIAKP